MKKSLYLLLTLVLLGMSGNSYAEPLNGRYYIGGTPGTRPDGGDPEFVTLGAAFTALNTNGINGSCEFYFLDASYTEPANLALACTGTSSTDTILFKPYTNVTTTIHFTANSGNFGPAGRIIFGSSSTASYNLVTMEYVTFDGSNAIGGTSRNLSFTEIENSLSSHAGISFVGDVNNITLKNINFTLSDIGTSSSFGVLITPVNQSSSDCIPNNILIENCGINSFSGNECQGIGISQNGAVTTFPTGIKLYNNTITASTRGIYLDSGTGDTEIIGNEIKVVNGKNYFLSEGIYVFSVGSHTNNINIKDNKINQLRTNNAVFFDHGIVGIFVGAQGIYDISNNMISGFEAATTAENPSCIMEGIRISTETTNGITANIYNNSISIPNLDVTLGTGTIVPKGIVLDLNGASGTKVANIKNNLFQIIENDFSSYIFYRNNTDVSTLTSDYNNFSYPLNGKAGSYAGVDKNTLIDWQTASSQDANSISKAVVFESATDLHLTGASIGDDNLAGIPLASVSVDIDGDTRDTYFPYMGADENTTSNLENDILTPKAVRMNSIYSNQLAFGSKGLLGADGTTKFYTHWDATYLYLGWSGGKTNYTSDMFYAAIDTDPAGPNGTSNAIEGVGFLAGAPNPDFYVVYENNSSFYGAPVTNSNSFEVYGVLNAGWNWISRTGANDNVNSKVVFSDGPGEVRLRIPWATFGFTPAIGTKIGIVMWTNNAAGNYLWGRVPTINPINGNTPKTLENEFVFINSGSGVNPSADGILTALPVELTSFTASASNGIVTLNWSTATELNAYLFEVQRSDDNNNWIAVGDVKASGNSNSIKNYSFIDETAVRGKYYYRLKQIDSDGAFEFLGSVEVDLTTPMNYAISQNYPNPFNPETKINFTVPQASNVKLVVFNALGQQVATLFNGFIEAGFHSVNFDGSNLTSGVYFYQMEAGSFKSVKKMILTK